MTKRHIITGLIFKSRDKAMERKVLDKQRFGKRDKKMKEEMSERDNDTVDLSPCGEKHENTDNYSGMNFLASINQRPNFHRQNSPIRDLVLIKNDPQYAQVITMSVSRFKYSWLKKFSKT